jgi:hypothetical protein
MRRRIPDKQVKEEGESGEEGKNYRLHFRNFQLLHPKLGSRNSFSKICKERLREYPRAKQNPLSILKSPPKQPKTVTVQARVEESVKSQLELYAASYVITEALKLLFRKDDDFKRWAEQHTPNRNHERAKGDLLAKAL